MLLQLAWRNVWRNKTRSMVVVIAVALGLWGGIFSDAFMQGMADQQVYSTIHSKTGHIQLNKPGFLQNHDLELRLENADSIVAVIKASPGIAGVSAIIQQTAMASTSSSSAGIMVNAVNPVDQQGVSDLNNLLVAGDYFESERANLIVIGQFLADKLKVKAKSRIVLTLQSSTGDIIYGAFKVGGIYRTHDTEFDKQMVFVRYSDLQSLINFPQGAASSITVLLDKTEDTDKFTTSLQQEFPALQVQSWMELTPMLQMLSGTMMELTLLFVGIILIALAFGIINTMLMAVMDRTREIGMLAAVGMKPSRIFGMIMLETIFLAVTGALIGVAVSMVTVFWFGRTGINLAFVAEGFNAIGFSSIVYPSLSGDFYLKIAIMVIIIALIAGLFPARRAIALKPATAVRGE